MQEHNKKSKKLSKLNIIIVIIAFIALITYMAWKDGILKITNIFLNCDFAWLWLGLATMAFCWFIESYIINIGLKIFNKKLKIKESAKNCILGQFFSNLTPSATGGQPFQAYYMNKCGIDYSISTSVLLIKFICFQISLTLICATVLFISYGNLINKIQSFAIIVIISFAINALIACFLILIGFYKNIVISIAYFFLNLLKKIKIFKNPDEKFKKIKLEIEFFNKNFIIIFKNKKTISYIIFLTIIQILSFYLLNVAIALVFKTNLNLIKIYKIVVGAALTQLSSTFIPLPGAVGGAELAYCVFYNDIFRPETLNASLLLWRIYSFYIPIILGLLLFKSSKIKKELK